MDFNSRLKRVTDLFVEGTEVFLGHDENHKPVLIWAQKLNSFEVEEARRDGQVRRSERMVAMGKEDSPERLGVEAEIALWDTDTLAAKFVELKADQIYLDVYNDVQTDPVQRERLERIERMPRILEDAGAPDDDPRRAQLAEDQREWLTAVEQAQSKALRDAVSEAREQHREDLTKAYIELWRERQTLDVFIQERRITQLFMSMRVCEATDVSTGGKPIWDHSTCDHTQRLLTDRGEVRTLPELVLAKVIDALDNATVSQREAGNSGARVSSSDSSERASSATEGSTPSSQGETSSAAPTS